MKIIFFIISLILHFNLFSQNRDIQLKFSSNSKYDSLICIKIIKGKDTLNIEQKFKNIYLINDTLFEFYKDGYLKLIVENVKYLYQFDIPYSSFERCVEFDILVTKQKQFYNSYKYIFHSCGSFTLVYFCKRLKKSKKGHVSIGAFHVF